MANKRNQFKSTNKDGNGRRSDRSSRNRRKSKDTARDRSFSDELKTEEGTNNPAWHGVGTPAVTDTASFPFNRRTGSVIKRRNVPDYTIPGIMGVKVVPTHGYNVTTSGPLRIAAQTMYTTMRMTQSGAKNYDSVDMFIAVGAMANIYSFINWCIRLYAYTHTYSSKNNYYPKGFAAAEDISPVGLMDGTKISAFRGWLNNFITRASSFAIPNTLSYLVYLAEEYKYVYIDSPGSLKNQMYMFTPLGFHWFDYHQGTEEDPMNGAGELHFHALPANATLDQIMDYGNEMLDHVFYQEDIGTISGDIEKTWGANVVKLAFVPEFLEFEPTYDPMVLQQIKNARVIKELNLDSTNLVQVAQGLYSCMTLKSDAPDYLRKWMASDILLTVDNPVPTSAECMEFTRYIPSVMGADTSGNPHLQTGAFCVYALRLVTYNNETDVYDVNEWDAFYRANQTIGDIYKFVDFTRQFHYCPTVSIYSADLANIVGTTQDTENFTVIHNDDLGPVHDNDWLYMVSVPTIGLMKTTKA